MRIGWLLFLLIISLGVHSQNQFKADSILAVINNQRLSDEQVMSAYYWLSAYSSSPADELKYGKKLLDLARKNGSEAYKIKANLRIGVAHRLLGNLAQAFDFLFESADQAASNEAFKPLLVDIYAEISTCYTQNNDLENALHYGQKVISLLRKSDRRQELGLNLLNMGYDYYLIGKLDSAMKFYNESEQILQEVDMTIGLAYITGNRALVYWKQGNLEKAKNDLFKAIEMLKPFEDRYGMSDYYNKLGHIFLEKGEKQKAIDHSQKAMQMATEEGLKEQCRDAAHLLYLIYLDMEDFETAIKYQTQFHAFKDSIQNLETTQEIANLRTGYEVGQKQAEVDLLMAEKRINRIIIITGGIILLIVICLAFVIYYYSKAKTRLNLQLESQKQDLIALNNTKDKFFSIISHDLRGPANILSGFISVAKYLINEQNTDKFRKMLDQMEDSANSMVKLLDNLLHWALQQRGDFPYTPRNHSLKNILLDVAESLSPVAKPKNIELDLDNVKNFDIRVDLNSTSTIFRNLISNATKFTNEGGHIRITSETGPDQMCMVKVTDDGVGIPKEKLGRLFELKHAISTEGTMGESGVGLGLQLVYEFVQLNKGQIEVESEEGKGTTFTVYLPLAV